MSASKGFNIAGLKAAFAVVPDPDLRRRFQEGRSGLVDSVNLMGLVASEAAYRDGWPWQEALVRHLEGNRDHLARELKRRLPDIAFRPPEASFLAWLDCSALDLRPDPHAFFLQRARVGMSAGAEFGASGAGHVRLNFGCPRPILSEAVARIEAAFGSLRR